MAKCIKPSAAKLEGKEVPPKLFSFFAGAGLLDLGFELAGFDIAFANENHAGFRRAYDHARRAMGRPLPEYGCSAVSIVEFAADPVRARVLRANVAAAKAKGSLIGFIGGPPLK